VDKTQRANSVAPRGGKKRSCGDRWAGLCVYL